MRFMRLAITLNFESPGTLLLIILSMKAIPTSYIADAFVKMRCFKLSLLQTRSLVTASNWATPFRILNCYEQRIHNQESCRQAQRHYFWILGIRKSGCYTYEVSDRILLLRGRMAPHTQYRYVAARSYQKPTPDRAVRMTTVESCILY